MINEDKRKESGQIGKLKHNPNHEKSKDEVVYAQGCDLLTRFFRKARDYLFKSYFENISSTVSKTLSSEKPTVAVSYLNVA